MPRAARLLRVLLTGFAALSTLAHPAAARSGAKPNIVLVFLDNFGWGEPGFNGGGGIR